VITIARQWIALFKYLLIATSKPQTAIKIKITCRHLTLEVQFICAYLCTSRFACERLSPACTSDFATLARLLPRLT